MPIGEEAQQSGEEEDSKSKELAQLYAAISLEVNQMVRKMDFDQNVVDELGKLFEKVIGDSLRSNQDQSGQWFLAAEENAQGEEVVTVFHLEREVCASKIAAADLDLYPLNRGLTSILLFVGRSTPFKLDKEAFQGTSEEYNNKCVSMLRQAVQSASDDAQKLKAVQAKQSLSDSLDKLVEGVSKKYCENRQRLNWFLRLLHGNKGIVNSDAFTIIVKRNKDKVSRVRTLFFKGSGNKRTQSYKTFLLLALVQEFCEEATQGEEPLTRKTLAKNFKVWQDKVFNSLDQRLALEPPAQLEGEQVSLQQGELEGSAVAQSLRVN